MKKLLVVLLVVLQTTYAFGLASRSSVSLWDKQKEYFKEPFVVEFVKKTIKRFNKEGYYKPIDMLEKYISWDIWAKATQIPLDELYKYEVHIKNGKMYDYKNQLINTPVRYAFSTGNTMVTLFVLGANNRLFFYHKNTNFNNNKMFHSSFLGSGALIYSSGEMQVKDGSLVSINNISGHYRVKFHNFLAAIHWLHKKGFKFKDSRVNDFMDDDLQVHLTTIGESLFVRSPKQQLLFTQEKLRKEKNLKIKLKTPKKKTRKAQRSKWLGLEEKERKGTSLKEVSQNHIVPYLMSESCIEIMSSSGVKLKPFIQDLNYNISNMENDFWIDEHFFQTPSRFIDVFYIPKFNFKDILKHRFKSLIYISEFIEDIQGLRVVGVSSPTQVKRNEFAQKIACSINNKMVGVFDLDSSIEKIDEYYKDIKDIRILKKPRGKKGVRLKKCKKILPFNDTIVYMEKEAEEKSELVVFEIKRIIKKLLTRYDMLILTGEKVFYYNSVKKLMDTTVYVDKDDNRRFLSALNKTRLSGMDACYNFFREQFTRKLQIGLPQAKKANYLVDTTAGIRIYERSA
jgi:hypothetical protein